jgi:hypothetical protein
MIFADSSLKIISYHNNLRHPHSIKTMSKDINNYVE